MAPGISPASAIRCMTRLSRPTIARAHAILIRSEATGEAACTMLSPRFTADASIPQAFQSFRPTPRFARAAPRPLRPRSGGGIAHIGHRHPAADHGVAAEILRVDLTGWSRPSRPCGSARSPGASIPEDPDANSQLDSVSVDDGCGQALFMRSPPSDLQRRVPTVGGARRAKLVSPALRLDRRAASEEGYAGDPVTSQACGHYSPRVWCACSGFTIVARSEKREPEHALFVTRGGRKAKNFQAIRHDRADTVAVDFTWGKSN
jgi:hypothetical protein